jgi:hypothetical protein
MKPEEMPVVEATTPVRFGSHEKLMAHVVKHLIEGRDERWQHLLDERILAAARVEYREGRAGVALNTLARRYQAFVSDRLVRLCGRGQAHQHSCRYTWDLSSVSRKAVSQIIDGWPDQEKLVIAAAACVKGDQVGPYRLLTAFRPWPRLSASSHRRKARERLRNLQTVYPRCVLQIHDE